MIKKIKEYNKNGFTLCNFFTKEEHSLINQFALDWFYNLCKINKNDIPNFPIEKYHLWYKKRKIDHSILCSAKNRYVYPGKKIQRIIKNNKKIKTFLKKIGIDNFKMWDDGWGWIGFRLIRPGFNDGYPLSQKNWGIAKDVISCWFPVIGKSKSETLTIVPRSNSKKYEYYLPKNSKFTKGEYRLKKKYYNNIKLFNPKILKNEVIIYSPKTLHTESNDKIKKTRYNLEFRFKPIS
jgi:hypothetical protein